MSNNHKIKTLFLDIGGVLLTNGWDRHMRADAAEKFGIEKDEMDERHHLTFGAYEEGKLTLDDYLDRTIFWKDRDFPRDDFKQFMFAQSQPHADVIDFFRDLKEAYGLFVGAISDEGRELTEYRIEKFRLREIFDFFVSSCYVHMRKPDHDMFTMAMDIAGAKPENSLFIDDRALYIEVAKRFGMRGIHFTDLESCRTQLAENGLSLE